jgi:uncharacterized coiled-coil protein SlyX
MNDAQRYRMNAAECLSAAERCGPAYRDLTVSIAETWLALARHQEAMDELLATLSEDRSATATTRRHSRYPPDFYRLPLADHALDRGIASVQLGCDTRLRLATVEA